MPDHMTSPVWWQEAFKSRDDFSECAKLVLESMAGYKPASRHSARDREVLATALSAVALLGASIRASRGKGWPKERKPGP
jgi:hypothetical protein